MTAPYIWIGRKLRHAHAEVRGNTWPLCLVHLPNQAGYLVGNREVGYAEAFDAKLDMHCRCGYAVCTKTGPCAPPPPPPKDELPEGWKLETGPWTVTRFVHTSGAAVESRPRDRWVWFPVGVILCEVEDWKPTRAEAMAAALASLEPAKPAEPAEPELRPGWVQNEDGRSWKNESIAAMAWTAPWGFECATKVPMHCSIHNATLEEAMVKCEQWVAAERGSR